MGTDDGEDAMKIKWNGRALECEARGGLTRFELRNGGELRIGQRGIYLVAELSIRNGLVSTRLALWTASIHITGDSRITLWLEERYVRAMIAEWKGRMK